VASKAIGESALTSSGASMAAAKVAAEKNELLSEMVWKVGTGTPDGQKRVILLQGLAALKYPAPSAASLKPTSAAHRTHARTRTHTHARTRTRQQKQGSLPRVGPRRLHREQESRE
jgi:hypothetical protein